MCKHGRIWWEESFWEDMYENVHTSYTETWESWVDPETSKCSECGEKIND